jgi:hypothetical protein
MTVTDLEQTDPQLLARVLELADGQRRLWSHEELGAILRHQWTSPVHLDLESMGSTFRDRLQALPPEQQPGQLTFEELFHRAAPPLELLNLVKHFAKASRVSGESVLPAEIATVVYLTSIVVGRLRTGRRITEQSDESLLIGIQWVLQQPWVDQRTHALFHEAQRHLQPTLASDQ